MTTPVQFEDYPQTHEGCAAFVRDVFQSMGGTVSPQLEHYCEDGLSFVNKKGSQRMGGTVVHAPVRPGKRNPGYMSVEQDSFFMDFENACLANHWNSSVQEHPTGNKRHKTQNGLT